MIKMDDLEVVGRKVEFLRLLIEKRKKKRKKKKDGFSTGLDFGIGGLGTDGLLQKNPLLFLGN